MTQTKQDVHAIVLEELVRFQLAIGCEPPEITDETRPIGDLEKFDSQVAEDTTATILGRLGASAETKCPFTMREDGDYLRLAKIVDCFWQAAGGEEN